MLRILERFRLRLNLQNRVGLPGMLDALDFADKTSTPTWSSDSSWRDALAEFHSAAMAVLSVRRLRFAASVSAANLLRIHQKFSCISVLLRCCLFAALRRKTGLFTASRRKILQQLLRSLVEPFLVFLRFLAGFNGVLSTPDPNELFCSRVIHTHDKSPDVIG
jgi:hypothetical protein